jgi:hypothetical protein
VIATAPFIERSTLPTSSVEARTCEFYLRKSEMIRVAHSLLSPRQQQSTAEVVARSVIRSWSSAWRMGSGGWGYITEIGRPKTIPVPETASIGTDAFTTRTLHQSGGGEVYLVGRHSAIFESPCTEHFSGSPLAAYRTSEFCSACSKSICGYAYYVH